MRSYQRVLERISGMPSSVCKIGKRILAYIACSPLPIMVREMEQLILLDPGVLEEVLPVRASMNVIQYCGPLVEVVDNKLEFVHFTVKEYGLNIPSCHGLPMMLTTCRYICARDVTGEFIDPSEALLDLTETCLRYLSTDLFDEDAADDELEKNIVSGRFRLSYFACDQWYSLTRLCIIGSKDAAVPERLISALQDFVMARGSPSQEPTGPRFGGPTALESVKDDFPETHAFLWRMANFNKKKQDTGNWRLGEADTWAKFDPTTLSVSSSRIHHLLDRTIATATHGTKLQFHYGPGLYRCDYILCSSNRLGFTTTSARDADVVRHERPFKCSKAGCEFAIIGFTSQKKRDDHCGSLHPVLSTDQTAASGIVIPNDPMEASARLAQLVAADRVADVNEIMQVREKHVVPTFKEAFLQDLMRRVAVSGSQPMCRVILDKRLLVDFNYSEMTTLAIQGRNERALIHLCSSTKGIRAVLASDSLWAFNVLTAAYGSDSDGYIESALVQFSKSPISAVQEPRLVGFLTRHRPFHAVGIKDLTSILQNTVVTSRLYILSRFLVESGADPNISPNTSMKRIRPYPLHMTLRTLSSEAAEFAKFLLLSGADPYKTYKSTMTQSKGKRMLPGMEPGAQNIQKWLGMTWDELVDWSQEERARRGQTVYRKLNPVEIEELLNT